MLQIMSKERDDFPHSEYMQYFRVFRVEMQYCLEFCIFTNKIPLYETQLRITF